MFAIRRFIQNTPRTTNMFRSLNNFRYLSNLNFTETGEWFVRKDNVNVIGLTRDSLEQLSEVVYVEALVTTSENVSEGDELVAVESVKATATIDAFNDCEIVDINEDIFDNLDTLNNDPENVETSWIIKTTV